MFTFKHIKTPAWANSSDIYFLALDESNNEFGYIGLQDLDFSKGVCGNLCYKTHKNFRGQGISKHYLKEFLEWCPIEFDIIKAYVKRHNVPSIKMLEFCGFERKKEPETTEEKKLGILKQALKRVPENNKIRKDEISKEIEDVKKIIEKEKEKSSILYKLKKFDYHR